MSEDKLPYFKRLQLIKQGLAPKEAVKKERKPIPKKSEKKLAEEKAERERLGGEDSDLVKWYKSQMKRMNVCEETGMKLETNIYKYAIMSICHILPKAYCSSVAVHPMNKIFLLPDLHFKWDNSSWEEREKWSCWPIVQERLIHLWEHLSFEEKKYFPTSVRNYIEKNKNLPI